MSTPTESALPPSPAPAPAPPRNRTTPVAGRGAPFVWLTGVGLALGLVMVGGLLALVLWNGTRTFWPRRITEVVLADGTRYLGEVVREDRYRPEPTELEALPAAVRARIAAQGGLERRRLLRTGNFDLYGDDFKWVSDHQIASESQPLDAWLLERSEWGTAIGRPESVSRGDQPIAQSGDAAFATAWEQAHREARARARDIHDIEQGRIGDVNHELERSRLRVKSVELESGAGSPEHVAARAQAEQTEQELNARYARLQAQVAELRAADAALRVSFREAGGALLPERRSDPGTPLLVSQVVRAYPANALGTADRLRVYLSRWGEFLTAEPREANTEGGVFPAIFGTFLMTVLMSAVVTPFGVVAALYLREYAKQGALVSLVRIAVNNLAGVPSIVFGVFGLGFLCYGVGGQIDQLFYAERLPAPTFGTGGILWASLTLALLTVPVVIVSTEEALAAVPKSQREGSYACGASKWQTIQRIVLPSATPGILTGLILAMARGAGEVAPLMITGVVKLAPELPFDHRFPFFHLERSFMHLGFHIYDVGFQSRNSEAGKPMVFTTTLLLIVLVTVLNLAAIRIRARLRQRYRIGAF